MNDALGPNDVVSSSRVFGEHPPVYTLSGNQNKRSEIDERIKFFFEARTEIEQHMAKVKIDDLLHHAVQPSFDFTYKRNDEVLIRREKLVNNRIDEWARTYLDDNLDAEKELIFVRNSPVGLSRPFSLARIKRYLCRKVFSHTFVCVLFNGLCYMSHALETRMKKVIQPDGPRAKFSKMKRAIHGEVKGLWAVAASRTWRSATYPVLPTFSHESTYQRSSTTKRTHRDTKIVLCSTVIAMDARLSLGARGKHCNRHRLAFCSSPRKWTTSKFVLRTHCKRTRKALDYWHDCSSSMMCHPSLALQTTSAISSSCPYMVSPTWMTIDIPPSIAIFV